MHRQAKLTQVSLNGLSPWMLEVSENEPHSQYLAHFTQSRSPEHQLAQRLWD